MQRTVLEEFGSKATGFTAEKWFMPVDDPIESITRMALVWHTNGKEHVVLISPHYAARLALCLMEYAERST